MKSLRVNRAAWEALADKDRDRVTGYLTEKGVVGGDVATGDVAVSGRSFKAPATTKGHYEDVVDACDGLAQIIHDGMLDSGEYSPEEAGDFAGEFFDHCCTVHQ